MYRSKALALLVLGTMLWGQSGPGKAAESAFSGYGLGAAAFGAGVTPPPGTYVTLVGSYYTADIGGTLTIGGAVLDLGLDVDFFSAGVNGVYVPDRTILGGRPAISVTLPVGYIDLKAGAEVGARAGTREVDGFGLGDMVARAQLGWENGDFSHLVYVQGVAPTGRYDTGFSPNIGLNRPSVDVGWAFTWAEKTSKLQFNGALGFTFSVENDETDYKTGNEFHFEWAVGREVYQGLVIGVVGYNYRQISGDSGPGARLGPFEGDVDAVGAGLSYTTLIDKTPVVFNLRHYEEFNPERHWDGSTTIFSGTMKF
jgi:hypothetical protein